MTDDEHADRLARLRAARAAAGRAPFIVGPAPYQILAAVLLADETPEQRAVL